MKFESLLAKVGKQYLLTEEQLGISPDQGSAIDAVQQTPTAAPDAAAQPQSNPEQKPLTVEGKRFLIELALKSLAVNPDELSEQEKSLFQTEVTSENAEKILNQLQSLIDQHS